MKQSRMFRRGLLSGLALLSACVGPTAAEQATFDAVAPEYRAYVDRDPALDQLQKQRRFDTIESWKLRVGR